VRRWIAYLLLTLAALLTVAGGLAGWANRQLLDSTTCSYTFPKAADFTCTLNRGKPDSPLLLVNHWLSSFTTLYTDAQQINALSVLTAREQQCAAERGRRPNLVAVNWINIGDVQQVIDGLNDV
jgi:hypothetical protein